jgi:hypothetical protein
MIRPPLIRPGTVGQRVFLWPERPGAIRLSVLEQARTCITNG